MVASIGFRIPGCRVEKWVGSVFGPHNRNAASDNDTNNEEKEKARLENIFGGETAVFVVTHACVRRCPVCCLTANQFTTIPKVFYACLTTNLMSMAIFNSTCLRPANHSQRQHHHHRPRSIERGFFYALLLTVQITAHLGTPITHKKTRKRTATFSNGLLDIAAEDRRGFSFRSLPFYS